MFSAPDSFDDYSVNREETLFGNSTPNFLFKTNISGLFDEEYFSFDNKDYDENGFKQQDFDSFEVKIEYESSKVKKSVYDLEIVHLVTTCCEFCKESDFNLCENHHFAFLKTFASEKHSIYILEDLQSLSVPDFSLSWFLGQLEKQKVPWSPFCFEDYLNNKIKKREHESGFEPEFFFRTNSWSWNNQLEEDFPSFARSNSL